MSASASPTTAPLRLGLVGLGKIARDQHLPAIAALPDRFELAAVSSRNASLDGVPCFRTLDAMLAARTSGSGPELDAVAFCTPPLGRAASVRSALDAGLHVLMEKPPGATLSEIAPLASLADERSRTLFAAWHSRFAPAVGPARALLAARQVRAVRVSWKEDVRVWHPGQDWIWQPGGFGVFDPAINALSILTRILPQPFALRDALLRVPANRDAPVAATLRFADTAEVPVTVELDFLHPPPEVWTIDVDTDAGPVSLSGGGKRLFADGAELPLPPETEYRDLYRHFAALVAERRSDVDLSPLAHVADSFLLGRRESVAPFHDPAQPDPTRAGRPAPPASGTPKEVFA